MISERLCARLSLFLFFFPEDSGFSIFEPAYDPTQILENIDEIRDQFGDINDKIIGYHKKEANGVPHSELEALKKEIEEEWEDVRTWLSTYQLQANMQLMIEGLIDY